MTHPLINIYMLKPPAWAALINALIINGLQNAPFCLLKCAVSQPETAHLGTQYRPFHTSICYMLKNKACQTVCNCISAYMSIMLTQTSASEQKTGRWAQRHDRLHRDKAADKMPLAGQKHVESLKRNKKHIPGGLMTDWDSTTPTSQEGQTGKAHNKGKVPWNIPQHLCLDASHSFCSHSPRGHRAVMPNRSFLRAPALGQVLRIERTLH